ncbi:hypothetical protein AVDCRST_MAG82-858 [uncultured Rubrobacteraceae bacterium]|uniref:Peripheral subunit-binding (PSBD) domain-containing protein n=1 Tax=uncultured Rubrobacteraceae bacterium TaxID=349277 RepID=A0A6J4PFD9_9ACTN|nr:hypothetical protein AVDCRST_MAG82-858 [uncultured Rubrobacteraceae bacterium]
MGKEQSEELRKRLAGYQIYDRHYEKVGKVGGLFVDENDELEYIGVKTGLFGGPSVLIPMEIVRINDARRLIEVASDREDIENAPGIDDDAAEITAGFEDRVYAHFGVARGALPADRGGYGGYYDEASGVDLAYGERADARMSGVDAGVPEAQIRRERDDEVDASDAARRKADELGIDLTQVEGTGSGGRVIVSDVTGLADRGEPADRHAGEIGPGIRMGDTRSGEFRGHAPDDEGVGQRRGSDLEDENELRVQRSEEELRVATREREAGSVNVRKRVRTDRERLSVPIRREEVTVERILVEGEATEAQIGDEEVTMPVVEQEVVVQKRPVVKEEIRVRKDIVEEQQIVEEDVRREEVEVEDATRRREE